MFQGIWEAIKSVFEAIGGVIEKIAPKFADFISELASGKVDTEKWVKVGEAIAKIGVAIAGTIIAVKTVIAVVRTVIGVVKGVTAAISFLTSPIGLVIAERPDGGGHPEAQHGQHRHRQQQREPECCPEHRDQQ